MAPLVARARAEDPDGRLDAPRQLLAHEDYGLVDRGLVVGALAAPAHAETPDESALRLRLLAGVARWSWPTALPAAGRLEVVVGRTSAGDKVVTLGVLQAMTSEAS